MLQATNVGHCRFLNSKDPSSPSVEKVGGVMVTTINCLCARHCIRNFTGISCNSHHSPL